MALDLLRREPFDLLLLDIEMPEMDGFQVLEQLKADPQLRDLPVIVTSVVEGLDSVVRCIELGAEDYLHKPVNPVLLKARIGASLEKKRLRDQQKELVRRFATPEVAQDLDAVRLRARRPSRPRAPPCFRTSADSPRCRALPRKRRSNC